MATSIEQSNEFREELANMFIEGLEKDGLNWKRGWLIKAAFPENAASHTAYRGINRLYLMFISRKMGYDDPRWMTFKQIRDRGYHLQKGAKGAKVGFWIPYDPIERRSIPWKEYYERINTGQNKETDFSFFPRFYTVFNASKIDGIPPIEREINNSIEPDKLIDKLSEKMGVPIKHTDPASAYYAPLTDEINLPPKEAFYSSEKYNATALHELAHSTGAAHRLNREGITKVTSFGSEQYAKEELIAEMTATFMSCHTGIDPTVASEFDNHQAYINHWIKDIKDDPSILTSAIKKADEAAVYMEKTAGIDLKKVDTKSAAKDNEETLQHQNQNIMVNRR